jgi:hypothetical protein
MPSTARTNPLVMETEEVQSLAFLLQMHDPRLGVLELKAQLRQDLPKRRERRLGFCACSAQRQQIVCVAHKNSGSALGPLPVKPVQIDVAQARRDHAALRGSGAAAPGAAISSGGRRGSSDMCSLRPDQVTTGGSRWVEESAWACSVLRWS